MENINFKLDKTDYQTIQKMFMDIPFKEYVRYCYPLIGYRFAMQDAMNLLLDLSSCDTNYMHSFSDNNPEENLTIGQMLKIAVGMLKESEHYEKYDSGEVTEVGLKIVELLVLVPFALMMNKQNRYPDITELKSFRKRFNEIKEI